MRLGSRSQLPEQKIHVGTSGWHYTHWRGDYYPEDLTSKNWLSYYASQFHCVEVNNSFYKLPKVTTIESWLEQAPSGFLFAVKASRLITHMKKLQRCNDVLETFINTIRTFGITLGPILFQLPPHWRINPERLAQFIKILSPCYFYAFEFRDPSWHTSEIYDLLTSNNIAFCIYDLAGFQSPREITADFAYIRLHGPNAAYSGSYTRHTLKTWAGRIRGWSSQASNVYVFFDNDEAGYAVKNASLLQNYCYA